MICLRCGYCCKYYVVVVINDPSKPLEEDNLISHMGTGEPCKHLKGERPGEYSCAIHEEPCYEETPCFRHGQVERSPDTPCRIGKHMLSKEESK